MHKYPLLRDVAHHFLLAIGPWGLRDNLVHVQISIRVATLDFFCNRPTVVTLIEFGCALSDISLADVGEPLQGTEGLISSPEFQTDSAESKGRDIVRGLLGRGKSRVIFRLRMDMETARIFLNKEDGSVLAMLAQEKFQMDLKVARIETAEWLGSSTFV